MPANDIPVISQLYKGTDSTKAPLILIHPISGMSTCYYSLFQPLAKLNFEHNVWVINSPLHNSDMRKTIYSQADLVENYAKTITSHLELQNITNFYIGGWSYGATLAFEISQRLEFPVEMGGCGKTVEAVFLIDPPLVRINDLTLEQRCEYLIDIYKSILRDFSYLILDESQIKQAADKDLNEIIQELLFYPENYMKLKFHRFTSIKTSSP